MNITVSHILIFLSVVAGIMFVALADEHVAKEEYAAAMEAYEQEIVESVLADSTVATYGGWRDRRKPKAPQWDEDGNEVKPERKRIIDTIINRPEREGLLMRMGKGAWVLVSALFAGVCLWKWATK